MGLRILATVTALLASGCGQSAEQVVTSTSHCTDVQVTPNLLMRLSSYAGHPDSIRLFVVQACHPTGTACSPILTYDHAPPPIYEVNGNTVEVQLLGGGKPRVHNGSINMGTETYEVIVQSHAGRGAKAFYRQIQHRCPPSSRHYPE